MIRAILLASLAGLVACTALDFSGAGGASTGGASTVGGAGVGATGASGGATTTSSTGGAGAGGAVTTGGASVTGGMSATGGGSSLPQCPGDDAPACLPAETFDAAVPSGWSQTGVPTVIAGELVLPIPDSTVSYSRVETGDFSLDGCAIWVKLSEAESAAGYETRLLVVASAGFQATSGFYVFDGSLQLVGAASGTIPYDPVAHRWLRLRQTSGHLYYEASDNGDCWTTLDLGTLDPVNASARLVLFPGTTYPGTTRFDDLCVPF